MTCGNPQVAPLAQNDRYGDFTGGSTLNDEFPHLAPMDGCDEIQNS